jgi:hypothetical protein
LATLNSRRAAIPDSRPISIYPLFTEGKNLFLE